MATFSKRSIDNLQGVHLDLFRLMNLSIRNTPVDFTIVEGVRTVQRQQELYAQGRTKPGKIVTNADGVSNKSNHQAKADGYGHAVDLDPFVNGSVQVNDVAGLKRISDHIKSVARLNGINVVWGGDWKFVDHPHFELKP
jgi:peptidoglycan L-alanyl-D-glutamate endopeptidase CwlK